MRKEYIQNSPRINRTPITKTRCRQAKVHAKESESPAGSVKCRRGWGGGCIDPADVVPHPPSLGRTLAEGDGRRSLWSYFAYTYAYEMR